MKRELSIEIREAFRQRDIQCKSISVKQFCKSEQVRMCSHTIIQVGDITFYELADIDMLRFPQMAKQVSLEFSGMTNSILGLSEFYKDHDIQTSRKSEFHQMLRDRIKPNSNVLLICCVTEQSLPSAEAVEYCHKIRSYFQGSTNRDASDRV